MVAWSLLCTYSYTSGFTPDPATGNIIAKPQEADKEDVDAAVEFAKAALPAWSKVSGAERGKLLWKLADIMEQNMGMLADLESLDNGAKQSLGQMLAGGAPASLRYFAGWADKVRDWDAYPRRWSS